MLCLLLILLVAINYQNSLAYAMAFLLASTGMLALLHTWRNLSGLELTGLALEPCFAGQTAQVRVQLRSLLHGHQAVWLSCAGQPAVAATVPARGQVQAEISLEMPRRGLFAVGRIRIASSYPLGLWNAWSLVDLAQQALVYPKPVSSEQAHGGMASAQGEDGVQAAGRGVDDYEGLAAWRPGDSLARVNWKTWSKGQGLWVKQFSELRGTQTLLDFNALSGDVELRLSILCAQILELTGQDASFSLSLPGRQIAMGQGQLHQQECLRELALFGGGHGKGA